MNVAADAPRWPAALGDHTVQDSDGGVGVDPPVDGDGQASRVCSSTTLSSLRVLPSAVWSNW
jgi:hypothetical protein